MGGTASIIHGRIPGGAELPIKIIDNGDGTGSIDLGASITLSASELEIGHVVLKNDTTEDHADVGTDNHLNTVTRNRADWKVRELDTGGVANTPIAGPSQAIPAGFGVLVIADTANTDTVQVASVGESGTAGQFFVLNAGDALPITLKVTNMNLIEARSVTGTNQLIKLIVEV